MQSQSQSTNQPPMPGDDVRPEAAPELKKESKTMTALLWPALTVLAIAIVLIIVLALR